MHNIFCSAQTVLADGRVLVAGGHECTVLRLHRPPPCTNLFKTGDQYMGVPTEDIHDRRWYPTATTLPDGRALVTAGSRGWSDGLRPHSRGSVQMRLAQYLDQAHQAPTRSFPIILSS